MMPKVRITAFPCRWLALRGTFADGRRITWSTGEGTQIGDIQLFAVSATLGNKPEFAADPRRDAAHSIWRATTPVQEEFGSEEWPVQARFQLLLRLDCPVPKADLIHAGFLKRSWPQGSRGKMLRGVQVAALAAVLAKRNPKQRSGIFEALEVEGGGD